VDPNDTSAARAPFNLAWNVALAAASLAAAAYAKEASPLGALVQEQATYEREKSGLLAKARGKFVLIKGDKVHGTFGTQMEAIKEGWRLYPNQPIFTHLISDPEPVIGIYHTMINEVASGEQGQVLPAQHEPGCEFAGPSKVEVCPTCGHGAQYNHFCSSAFHSCRACSWYNGERVSTCHDCKDLEEGGGLYQHFVGFAAGSNLCSVEALNATLQHLHGYRLSAIEEEATFVDQATTYIRSKLPV
jgi:hypothetical protein